MTAAGAKLRRINEKYALGSHTPEQWQRLLNHHGNRCLACGKHRNEIPEGYLTKDHVIPLSRGGSNDIDNIQPLCLSCNASKGAKEIDYRKSA